MEQRTEWHTMRDWLQKKYGVEMGLFLAKRCASHIRKINDSCMDNFRIADLSNTKEVEAYGEARQNGCCGSCDVKIEHYKSGRAFMFGFNYGH